MSPYSGIRINVWMRSYANIPSTWGSSTLMVSAQEACDLILTGSEQALWGVYPVHHKLLWHWYRTLIQRRRWPNPTLNLLPLSFTRILSWKRVLKRTWPHPAQDQITPPSSPRACGRHQPSTQWLQISSTPARSIQDNFVWSPQFSTTPVRRIAWLMTPLYF